MKKIIHFILLFLLTSHLHANKTSQEMLTDLQLIKHLLEVGYAPTNWKRDYLNWDIENEFEEAKSQIITRPKMTLKEYQQLLKKFLTSTKDYHINIEFYSTEEASLPFQVKTVNDRTFIDWIDNIEWIDNDGQRREGLKVGDELIQFDGRSLVEVFEEIKIYNGLNSNPMTDQSLADLQLTYRSGSTGEVVPKGNVSVIVQDISTGKYKKYQFTWRHQTERITPPPYLIRSRKPLHFNLKQATPRRILGSKYSFVPKLGKMTWIWQRKNEEEDDIDDSFWNAYIYQNKEGRSIGYIRIPNYSGSKKDIKEFSKIISKMQKSTEALVIDQVDNGGGSVQYLYQLASMLTEQPLSSYKHQIKINQEHVFEAIKAIEYLETYDRESSDDESDEATPSLKKYFEFIIQEWNEGRTLTQPVYLFGIDKIQPSLKANYSKPILFLINELDFSCGDFMPAMLQDNHRALLFGTQTAGAGGAVKQHTFPNHHGIKSINYTWTLAERDDSQKIENLGIKPDIEYKISVRDIQNQYVDYGRAVNAAISGMLPPLKKRGNN